MLLGSQQTIHTNANELDIYLGNVKLKQVRSSRYLGIDVDCLLKWDCHVQTMCRNISGKLATLSRLRHFMSEEALNKIYRTKIMPCLDYGITVWANCNDNIKNLIFRLQKRATRIVKSNFDYKNVRGLDIINELRWQTIDKRRDYFFSTQMYKCIQGDAPVWLTNRILMVNENHDIVTRYASQKNVVIPRPNLESFRKSFQYQGAVVWNGLPSYLKEASSLDIFKKMYKQMYF